MVENFCRAFDALEEKRIMGIYGAAHTVIDGLDFSNSVPCMANRLHEIYGDLVHAEDLSQLDVPEPDFETIEVNGTAYPATYFGYQNTRSFLEEYQYRQYYRLENAYDDFKDAPTVQNVLPYNNYPTEMEIEVGQVFVIDYTTYDGTVERKFFRSDGKYWNETTQTLHAPSGEELNNHVTGFIDYGDWYLIDRQGSHTVYDLDGKIIAGNAHVLRKINGILFVRVENGQISLLHRSGKAILPPFAEKHLRLEETVF